MKWKSREKTLLRVTHTHTHTHTVYDIVGSTSDRNCVVLNNVHIDIMDYIQPASCTDAEFRKMWAEFEWENKVGWRTVMFPLPSPSFPLGWRVGITLPSPFFLSISFSSFSFPLFVLGTSLLLPPPSSLSSQITVNTNISDLSDYLEHLLKSTNMRCLTPKQVLCCHGNSLLFQCPHLALFPSNTFPSSTPYPLSLHTHTHTHTHTHHRR